MAEYVSDPVAVDAKRILLRYGAPIAVLDKISDAHRIEFAREIARTSLPSVVQASPGPSG